MAHWELSESSIEINQDYVLDTILTDEEEKEQTRKLTRIYNNMDYIPKIINKGIYQAEIIKGFFNDTTYKYDWIVSLAHSLSCLLDDNFLKYQILSDVIIIDEGIFNKSFSNLFDENVALDDINNMIKSLNYLICDSTLLKNTGQKIHDILPIWERENRNNRFDVKPIVKLIMT